MNRKQCIKEIANHILMLNVTHPTRVGVGGITASGKTTFANEVAEEIKKTRVTSNALALTIFITQK